MAGAREDEVYCLGCATRLRGPEALCPRCGLSRAPSLAGGAVVDVPGGFDATVTPVAWPPRMSDGIVVEGGYRIERFLARGGMGEVYEGLDTRLHRKVAIKFLADEFRSDRVLVQRFLREARAVASLDHPNIVAVHAVGEHDGRPLMVMKFVDGQTIGDLVRERGRFTVADASAIIVQVCDGLQHIHARGFIHRDIKPQNLMLDRDGRALILDFGILRGVSSTATATGMVFGTPAYMPPEQAKDAKLVDARSDLYALGVTFFEMLTGRLPFRGQSSLELLMKHQLDVPPAISEVVGDVPPAVAEVVRRVLEKDPQARFDSAAQMRDALRAALREPGREPVGEAPGGAALAAGPRVPLALPAPASSAPSASPSAAPSGSEAVGAFVPGSTTAIRGESLRLEVVAPSSARSRPPGFLSGRRLGFGLALGAVVALVVLGVFLFPRGGDDDRGSPGSLRGASAGAEAVPVLAAPAPAASLAPSPSSAPPPAAAASSGAVTPDSAMLAKLAKSAFAQKGSDSTNSFPPAEEDSPRTKRKPARLAARASAGSSPVPSPVVPPAPSPAPTPTRIRAIAPPLPTVAPTPAAAAPAQGTLRVVTLFEGKGLWARVLVDGRETGNRTHVWSDTLAAGTYVVTARREGYAAKELRAVVRAGETVRLRLELEKK